MAVHMPFKHSLELNNNYIQLSRTYCCAFVYIEIPNIQFIQFNIMSLCSTTSNCH